MPEFTQFTQKEVRELFEKAKRAKKHPALDLLIAPQQKENSRLLISISRKVGNAVVRNKIRRQIKGIFQELDFLTRSLDYILIARKDAINFSYAELKEIIRDAIDSYQKKMSAS